MAGTALVQGSYVDSSCDLRTRASFANWRKHLPALAHLPLLAVGGATSGKAPVDPRTGRLLGGWQSAWYTPEQVEKGVDLAGAGIRLGPDAGGVIALDLDGQTAIDHCRLAGCDPFGVSTWRIHRTTSTDRLKILFKVPQHLREQLPTVVQYRTKECSGIGAKDGEQIDIYWSKGQIVVLGEHRTSGGTYYWDGSPENIATIPDEWWSLLLSLVAGAASTDTRKSKAPKASNGKWSTLSDCPICGRDEHHACRINRDKDAILCLQGGTFAPPKCSKGEKIRGRDGQEWAFCSEFTNSNAAGTYSTFRLHRDRKPVDRSLLRKRNPKQQVGKGEWQQLVVPPADEARLVCLREGMGGGKTTAIVTALEPLIAAGTRVLVITHRKSLSEALANRLGLPCGEDAKPASDLRQQGLALCIDSLCSTSAMQIHPGDWRGCVVVIDEAEQVAHHALTCTATAIAKRRTFVLNTLSSLLKGASQVIAADAHLSDDVVSALEAATGATATIVSTGRQPAAGRKVFSFDARGAWRVVLLSMLLQQKRVWISTTAQQPGQANSAQTMAAYVSKHWPDARVLVVDSETQADPKHAASRLASDPNGVASQYDVVICTPALQAAVSVTLKGHFYAVLAASGGTTAANGVVQSLGRVRDDCPRFIYAPERSPGNHQRVGSGETDPQALLQNHNRHVSDVLAALAATADVTAAVTGPWLPLWAKFGARQNGERLKYRQTIEHLLVNEGYELSDGNLTFGRCTTSEDQADEELKGIATAAQEVADGAVITAAVIDANHAKELGSREHLSPDEQNQLKRHRISERWALGTTPPTHELLEADREGLATQFKTGWLLQHPECWGELRRSDKEVAGRMLWSPDLTRQVKTDRLMALQELGIQDLMDRTDWFTAEDSQLAAIVERFNASYTYRLGVDPGKRITTCIKRLLALVGYRLGAARKMIDGKKAWRYRVVRTKLPHGANWEAMVTAWQVPKKSPLVSSQFLVTHPSPDLLADPLAEPAVWLNTFDPDADLSAWTAARAELANRTDQLLTPVQKLHWHCWLAMNSELDHHNSSGALHPSQQVAWLRSQQKRVLAL